jgi:hypothetical protein
MELTAIEETIMQWVDIYVLQILESNLFFDLPLQVVIKIFERDTLFIDEARLFLAAKRWGM